MPGDRLIPLGVITAPHGIRGEVRIRSFTADPADIIAYGPLQDREGNLYHVTLKGFTKEVVIASVKGIASREAAEGLRNIELCVPRSALPATGGNDYYHEDLIGIALATPDGMPYGTIAAMHNFGAGDIASITRLDGTEDYIPFTRAAFPAIDVQQGTGIIVPPVVIAGE